LFGVLKGAGCRMKPSQKGQWMSHICGTCLALQESSGFISRIATNYDAVLLSVLYDAQLPDRVLTEQRSCILRRPHRFQSIDSTSSGSIFAASIAQLMAGTKIQDHLQDGDSSWRHAKGAAKRISERWINAAKESVQSLGFNTEIILNQTNRQGLLESRAGGDFYSYSKPTELAVGAAFGHTAVLANQPGNIQQLQKMGEMFGRVMYLLDSFQDYDADLKSNQFNPLVAAYPVGDWKNQTGKIFHQAYQELVGSLQRLDLFQPDLPQILLVKYLNHKGHRTLQLCSGERVGSCLPASRKLTVPPGETPLTHFEEWGEEETYDFDPNHRDEDRSHHRCCDNTPICECPDCYFKGCSDGEGNFGLSGENSCCELFCCDGKNCVPCRDAWGACQECCTCEGAANCCCDMTCNCPDCSSFNCDDIAGGDCDCGDCDCGDCDCGDCDFDCGGCD